MCLNSRFFSKYPHSPPNSLYPYLKHQIWFYSCSFSKCCQVHHRNIKTWQEHSRNTPIHTNFRRTRQFQSTDYYEVGKTRRAILGQFLGMKLPQRPIKMHQEKKLTKKKGRNGKYLFEYELCMLLGVFSTCWAKIYERSFRGMDLQKMISWISLTWFSLAHNSHCFSPPWPQF